MNGREIKQQHYKKGGGGETPFTKGKVPEKSFRARGKEQ